MYSNTKLCILEDGKYGKSWYYILTEKVFSSKIKVEKISEWEN